MLIAHIAQRWLTNPDKPLTPASLDGGGGRQSKHRLAPLMQDKQIKLYCCTRAVHVHDIPRRLNLRAAGVESRNGAMASASPRPPCAVIISGYERTEYHTILSFSLIYVCHVKKQHGITSHNISQCDARLT